MVGETRTEFWYHYVPHNDVPRWQANGWVRLGCLDGTNHGKYAALMEWSREGEPIIPEKTDDSDEVRVCA